MNCEQCGAKTDKAYAYIRTDVQVLDSSTSIRGFRFDITSNTTKAFCTKKCIDNFEKTKI